MKGIHTGRSAAKVRSFPEAARKSGARLSESVLDLFFNTPMLRLSVGEGREVLAKLESFSPGGSIKDRITLGIMEAAEEEGLLGEGSVVVEPSSGNTGIGLALVCAVKGYRCIITMPEDMSLERIYLLRNLGAEVVLTPAREGMRGAVSRAEGIAAGTAGSFTPLQYANEANPETHRRTTAQEIVGALEEAGVEPEAFVAGVGTGGSITGVGEVLRERWPDLRVYAVEPESSAVLSGREAGLHKIQGIGAGFVPAVLNRDVYHEVVRVADRDAFESARDLARRHGILCGLSSGAAFAAARRLMGLGEARLVVTLFPDTGERYFSVQQYFEL